MDFLSALRAGFESELTSISLTKSAGFLRSGRRPFKAATLLKRGPKVKKGAMVKLSTSPSESLLMKHKKPIALAIGGALAYDQARKAKRDWETGRAMRIQQGY